MKVEPLSLELLEHNLREATLAREPYDPGVDYEPPYNPRWAEAHHEYQYVTNRRYQQWWDHELEDLAACVRRWKAAAEAEPQMRLPFPQVCQWMYAEGTLARYAELKALAEKEGTQ